LIRKVAVSPPLVLVLSLVLVLVLVLFVYSTGV
jgi:hypothetical protein